MWMCTSHEALISCTLSCPLIYGGVSTWQRLWSTLPRISLLGNSGRTGERSGKREPAMLLTYASSLVNRCLNWISTVEFKAPPLILQLSQFPDTESSECNEGLISLRKDYATPPEMSIVDLPFTLLQSNLRLFVRMTILQEREIKL